MYGVTITELIQKMNLKNIIPEIDTVYQDFVAGTETGKLREAFGERDSLPGVQPQFDAG